jgi:hypothetical protein
MKTTSVRLLKVAKMRRDIAAGKLREIPEDERGWRRLEDDLGLDDEQERFDAENVPDPYDMRE